MSNKGGRLSEVLQRKLGKGPNKSIGIGGSRDISGFGYISIPHDIDRDTYINGVFNQGLVMITTSTNQVIKNALLPTNLFDQIIFPQTNTQVGSMIHWMNVPKTNQVVITGIHVAAGQYNVNRSEKKSITTRGTENDKIIEIKEVGSIPRYGVIVVDEADQDGSLSLKAYSTQVGTEVSLLNMGCDGEISFKGGKRMFIGSANEVVITSGAKVDEINSLFITKDGHFSYTDRHGNYIDIVEGTVTIEVAQDGEIKLGENATEKAVLGDKLQTELNKAKARIDRIIQAITRAAVATDNSGATFKANMIAILQGALSENYDSILSQKNKVE